jgi:hypothetical protein
MDLLHSSRILLEIILPALTAENLDCLFDVDVEMVRRYVQRVGFVG